MNEPHRLLTVTGCGVEFIAMKPARIGFLEFGPTWYGKRGIFEIDTGLRTVSGSFDTDDPPPVGTAGRLGIDTQPGGPLMWFVHLVLIVAAVEDQGAGRYRVFLTRTGEDPRPGQPDGADAPLLVAGRTFWWWGSLRDD